MNFKPEKTLKIINENVDIVDVIGSYLTLSKSGKGFKGLCPFHDDKNPSLTVEPTKKIFKCFSCGAGGGIIKFVMLYEKNSFKEALIKLVDKYNIPLDVGYLQPRERSADEMLVSDLTKEIHNFYRGQMINPPQKLRKYMNQRMFTRKIVQKYELGWAPEDQKALFEFLQQKKFKISDILKTELFTANEDEIKDYFHERIIFPLHNFENELVGFSGRTLDSEFASKFLISRENIIFQKSQVFFNWKYIQENFKTIQKIYIVEGFADAIMLTENEIPAVAMLGTSLSDAQIDALQKKFSEFVIVPDGDAPGYQSALKNSLKMKQWNLKVKIWNHQSKLDPDELIRQNKDIIKNHEQQIVTPINFIIAHHEKVNDEKETEKFKEEVNPFLVLANEVEKFWFQKIIKEKYSLPNTIFDLRTKSTTNQDTDTNTEIIESEHLPPISEEKDLNKIFVKMWEKLAFFYAFKDSSFRQKLIEFNKFFCTNEYQENWEWVLQQNLWKENIDMNWKDFLEQISAQDQSSWFKMLFNEVEEELSFIEKKYKNIEESLIKKCYECSLDFKIQKNTEEIKKGKIDLFKEREELIKKLKISKQKHAN